MDITFDTRIYFAT